MALTLAQPIPIIPDHMVTIHPGFDPPNPDMCLISMPDPEKKGIAFFVNSKDLVKSDFLRRLPEAHAPSGTLRGIKAYRSTFSPQVLDIILRVVQSWPWEIEEGDGNWNDWHFVMEVIKAADKYTVHSLRDSAGSYLWYVSIS